MDRVNQSKNVYSNKITYHENISNWKNGEKEGFL